MDLRTSLVFFGCCFCYYVAAVCVDRHCTISNCTQNPRIGIDEDMFYCSISSREGCAKLKEKFQDQKESSSEDSPPLLKRLTLYVYKHFAALNITFQIHSGRGDDLPATEAVTVEFWSIDDAVYNSTCKAFNFSPQRVTPAIPVREITDCNISSRGLSQGTDQKRETLYFLKLTAFPSKSSITYHMLYQGWTFEEIPRLQCNSNAAWRPLIAVARRPTNGNIHVVVEYPPREFNVQEIEFAVFCGKRAEEEMVPLQRFIRKIFKDDSYQLLTEFKDLPPEQCAVKVTPKCMDAGKCNESWSHWLDINRPGMSSPGIHVAAVVAPVVAVCLLVLGIVGFVLHHQRKRPDQSSPQKSIFVTSLSINRNGSLPRKIGEMVTAFAEMLRWLKFEVTETRAVASREELLCQLRSAHAIVLLCIPGKEMVARHELLHELETNEDLQKKCILGCLQTAEQGCQHSLDLEMMEEGIWEEARDGMQERLLPPAFPQLTAALRTSCRSLVDMDENKFHDFYVAILGLAEPSRQPITGYAETHEWVKLESIVNEQPGTPDSSSISSSGSESRDDEDSRSESDTTSSSENVDSSADDQGSSQLNGYENHNHAEEDGGFSRNHNASGAYISPYAQSENVNPETQSTPQHGGIHHSAGGQNARFPHHHQAHPHAPYPEHGNREPNGFPSQCLGHCTNGLAPHPGCPVRMHQSHMNNGHSHHHSCQSYRHCEPGMHVCFACQGNQVVRGGNNGSCPCQHTHHQRAAVCVHQGGSSGHCHCANGMHGHM